MSVDIKACQCQACHHPGVEMFDICPVCNWENDFSLEDSDYVYHDVSFVLSEEESSWWSCANGSSPATHRVTSERKTA